MATQSACANLKEGQDVSCAPPARRYFQQAVIINKADIDPETIVTQNDPLAVTCEYSVDFSLKADKTGFLFRGSENGSTYKGTYDKTTNETFGLPDYIHHAQMLVVGVDEPSKCILASLDKGSYVVAMQYNDGVVEIFGLQNGMTTDDYTYDPQEGGGGQVIIMSSREVAPESTLPLVFKPAATNGSGILLNAPKIFFLTLLSASTNSLSSN